MQALQLTVGLSSLIRVDTEVSRHCVNRVQQHTDFRRASPVCACRHSDLHSLAAMSSSCGGPAAPPLGGCPVPEDSAQQAVAKLPARSQLDELIGVSSRAVYDGLTALEQGPDRA